MLASGACNAEGRLETDIPLYGVVRKSGLTGESSRTRERRAPQASALMLGELMPELRVVRAHGQMAPGQHDIALMLSELVPELRIVRAHDQMAPTQLDDVMNAFYEGQ